MIFKRFALIALAGILGLSSFQAMAESTDQQVSSQSSIQIEPIDINTASAEQLMQLDNVGPSKAQAIIDYRELNGPFAAPEDLQKVKGIGATTIDKNRERMLVGQ